MTANPNPGGNVYKREGEDLHEAWNAVIRKVNEERENPPEDTDCEPLDPIDEADENHIWTVQDVEDIRAAINEMCPYDWQEDLIYWHDAIIIEIEASMDRDYGGWGDEGECCEETGEPITTEFGPYIYDGQLLEASVCKNICCGVIECSAACYICGCECGAWAQHMGEYWPPNGSVLDSYLLTTFYAYSAASSAWLTYVDSIDDALDAAKEMEQLQDTINHYVEQVDWYIAAYESCLAAHPGNPTVCNYLKTYICYYGNLAREKQNALEEKRLSVIEALSYVAPAAAECNTQAAISWAAQKACPGGRYPTDVNLMSVIAENYEGYEWSKWFRPRFDESIRDCYPDARLNGVKIQISPNGTPYKQGLVLIALTVIYQRIITWHICDHWSHQTCYWNCTDETIPACETFSHCTLLEITGDCGSAPKESDYLWGVLHDIADGKHFEYNGYVYDPLGRQGKDYTDEQTEYWNEHINWYDEHPSYDDRHEAYC